MKIGGGVGRDVKTSGTGNMVDVGGNVGRDVQTRGKGNAVGIGGDTGRDVLTSGSGNKVGTKDEISIDNDVNSFAQKPLSGTNPLGTSTVNPIWILVQSNKRFGSSCKTKERILSLLSRA